MAPGNSISIDAERYEVVVDGKSVSLSPKQFRLLLELKGADGKVLSGPQLRRRIWGTKGVSLLAVSQMIKNLRRKLGDHPRKPRFIKTVTTVGWRFIGQA